MGKAPPYHQGHRRSPDPRCHAAGTACEDHAIIAVTTGRSSAGRHPQLSHPATSAHSRPLAARRSGPSCTHTLCVSVPAVALPALMPDNGKASPGLMTGLDHTAVVTAGRSEPGRQRPSNYSYHRR